jgi:tetratricopeptide (TPR) repeat protein
MVRCFIELGAFADAMTASNEARQLAEADAQPFEYVVLYRSVGLLHVRQGTLHQAITVLERAVALGRESDIGLNAVVNAVQLALAYALAGRTTDALPLLGQLEGFEVFRGEAYLYSGEVEEADRLAQRGLAHARACHRRGWEAWALWVLGEAAIHRDPLAPARAAAHYQQALGLAEALGMRPLQAHCHRGLGRLYSQTGRRVQACAALTTALAMYRAMEMMLWIPQTEATLVEVQAR